MVKNVTLLTGFLGAGKTTLLNTIVSTNTQTRYAIIENEIGSEGIDGELIEAQKSNLIELNDGCICCSIKGEIYTALQDLIARENEWDELIIEATGIADPAGIAQPFLTDPVVMSSYSLKRIICVVDASLVENELKETEIAIRQIGFSDILLINKVDQIPLNYLPVLEEILQHINPLATVLHADNNNRNSISSLVNFERKPQTEEKTQTFRIGRIDPLFSGNSGMEPFLKASTHNRHSHSDIETILLRYEVPFELITLEHRLRVFLFLQSSGVYRIKCIVNAEGYDHKIIVQSVGPRLSITRGQPWQPDEKPESKIVIIGKCLQLKGFNKIFTSCLKK